MLEALIKHFKKYWPRYLLLATFPIGFGVYTGIFLGISRDNDTSSPILPHSPQSACALETNSFNFDACSVGMNGGYSLINELLKNSDHPHPVFPDFSQLSPVCQPYYDNSNLTASCLNGLVTGAQSGLQRVKDRQDLRSEDQKNSLEHAAIATAGSVLFFTVGACVGAGICSPAKENEENPLLEV